MWWIVVSGQLRCGFCWFAAREVVLPGITIRDRGPSESKMRVKLRHGPARIDSARDLSVGHHSNGDDGG